MLFEELQCTKTFCIKGSIERCIMFLMIGTKKYFAMYWIILMEYTNTYQEELDIRNNEYAMKFTEQRRQTCNLS